MKPEKYAELKIKRLRLQNFLKEEDGAVTVDWVVLTAAIVGIGLVVLNIVRGGVYTTASDVDLRLSNAMYCQTYQNDPSCAANGM